MACGLIYLEYLKYKGCFKRPKLKFLDIGSQNLLGADFKRLKNFIHSLPGPKNVQKEKIENLVERATIGPGIETTYLSEIFENTSIQYDSLDVALGKKTILFDLNTDYVSEKMREQYDLVVNFGTTEHVFNQYNAFKVIHDAAKEDGFIFHQVPAFGYYNHSYFTYQSIFFRDLAKANDYEIIDLWFTGPQGATDCALIFQKDKHKNSFLEDFDFESMIKYKIPNSVINCLIRKRNKKPFRIRLELETSHAKADKKILEKYK